MRRLLMSFPCGSCTSSSFAARVGSLKSSPQNSSADVHETFRYPPNSQDLQKSGETYRRCLATYHAWAMIMWSISDWAAIVPIYPNRGKFQLPHGWNSLSKRSTCLSFPPTIQPTAPRTLSIFNIGTYNSIWGILSNYLSHLDVHSREIVARWTAGKNSESWKFVAVPQNEPLSAIHAFVKVYKSPPYDHRKENIQSCTRKHTGLVFISTDIDAVGSSHANFFARFSDEYLDVAANLSRIQ